MHFKLFYYRTFRRERFATAYHEAGHCAIAELFREYLHLNSVSINVREMRQIDPSMRGALFISAVNSAHPLAKAEDADRLLLIAIAGICGRTIHTRGRQYVVENLPRFPYDSTGLDHSGSQGDLELMREQLDILAPRLSIGREVIWRSGIIWIFQFMLNERGWRLVHDMALELMRHPTGTLSSKEIAAFYGREEYQTIIREEGVNHIQQRHPLDLDRLSIPPHPGA